MCVCMCMCVCVNLSNIMLLAFFYVDTIDADPIHLVVPFSALMSLVGDRDGI